MNFELDDRVIPRKSRVATKFRNCDDSSDSQVQVIDEAVCFVTHGQQHISNFILVLEKCNENQILARDVTGVKFLFH
jgi:hypothetical protein